MNPDTNAPWSTQPVTGAQHAAWMAERDRRRAVFTAVIQDDAWIEAALNIAERMRHRVLTDQIQRDRI